MNRKILYSGTLLYILLIPLFYHSDIKEIYFKSQFLSQGIIDVYSHINNNLAAAQFGPFAYQPLTYFLFGSMFVIIKLFAGAGFQDWLAMGNDAVGVEGLFRYLFLMKFPLVIVFGLSGYFLSKIFADSRKKNLALLLWFFNPISIYVVGLVGQFDIFPVFLSILALYYASRKPGFAAVLLGLGAGMKGFPILLLPFLVILIEGNVMKRLKVLVLGVITFLLTISPFITNRAFYESTALSGLSQRIFIPGISFGFDEKFMLIPGMYLLLIYLAINFDYQKVNNLYKYFFSSMFLLTASVHFHAQWALWYLPFLIIILVKDSRLKKPLFSISSIVLILGYFATVFLIKDRYITVGLLSVFDPAVYFLPSPFEFVSRYYDPLVLQSIFHSFYLVSGLVVAVKVIYEKNPK